MSLGGDILDMCYIFVWYNFFYFFDSFMFILLNHHYCDQTPSLSRNKMTFGLVTLPNIPLLLKLKPSVTQVPKSTRTMFIFHWAIVMYIFHSLKCITFPQQSHYHYDLSFIEEPRFLLIPQSVSLAGTFFVVLVSILEYLLFRYLPIPHLFTMGVPKVLVPHPYSLPFATSYFLLLIYFLPCLISII